MARRCLLSLLFLSLAAFVECCRGIPVTGPVQQNTVIINLGPTPSPTPTPAPPDCSITSIAITSEAGPSFAPGDTVLLDATPRGGLTGGSLPATCAAPPIAWGFSANTASCSFVGSISTYNPNLRCEIAGAVTVKATVSGVVGEASFTVRE